MRCHPCHREPASSSGSGEPNAEAVCVKGSDAAMVVVICSEARIEKSMKANSPPGRYPWRKHCNRAGSVWGMRASQGGGEEAVVGKGVAEGGNTTTATTCRDNAQAENEATHISRQVLPQAPSPTMTNFRRSSAAMVAVDERLLLLGVVVIDGGSWGGFADGCRTSERAAGEARESERGRGRSRVAGDASGEKEEARSAGRGDEMQQMQQMAAGCRDGKGEKWRREQKSGRPQLMTERE